MKRLLRSLLGASAIGFTLHAQTPPSAEDKDHAVHNVHAETKKLIMADAKTMLARNDASAVPLPETKPDAVMMSPYIVKAYKDPKTVSPPKESYTMRYLKTGKLYEHVGKTMTTTIKFQGAAAPMGFAGAQISINLRW